ncbi:hypothetical protein [Mesorhizobium sp. M2A.F.Ca.ET.039.01.1.1]|uniref:hypothetical protein n=1 Tax=Mesorhizobium sp. M2A.F.Ca.ET.039.01.1.1 TaxID=2496746 RepID=UPI000FCBB188|nr:hypothetical protein [Mesorhizobium sp. M2A.F.Ca.ET.039.01.1.1]RWX72561.1 hypothetical protein EOA24_00795 [Mesorhizobium sp. M2A.F.Ca.ET.039.01.1.1]
MADPDQVVAELSRLIRDFTDYDFDRLIAAGDHEIYDPRDGRIVRLRSSDPAEAARVILPAGE